MTPCHSITPTSTRVPVSSGPMNMVIESSCTKWRTGKRSAWSIAFIRDAVPVGAVEDDGFRLHVTCLLAARALAKRSLSPRLRPDRTPVDPEATRQCAQADTQRAGCSHSVHFLVGEACSRSFLWFRRRPDRRVIGPVLRLGILADTLIPRGNQPLSPWPPVPVVLRCVHLE